MQVNLNCHKAMRLLYISDIYNVDVHVHVVHCRC